MQHYVQTEKINVTLLSCLASNWYVNKNWRTPRVQLLVWNILLPYACHIVRAELNSKYVKFERKGSRTGEVNWIGFDMFNDATCPWHISRPTLAKIDVLICRYCRESIYDLWIPLKWPVMPKTCPGHDTTSSYSWYIIELCRIRWVSVEYSVREPLDYYLTWVCAHKVANVLMT